MGEDDPHHGELWIRDDRLLPNDARAQTPEAAQLHHAAIRFGEWLVLAGIVATVLSGFSHWKTLRRMERGELPHAARWPLSITVALFVTLLGAAGLLSLVTSR